MASDAGAGGFRVRREHLQKCDETVQNRSRLDDRRDYERSNIEYSMEQSRQGTSPAAFTEREDSIPQRWRWTA